jgi:hypothetical protein
MKRHENPAGDHAGSLPKKHYRHSFDSTGVAGIQATELMSEREGEPGEKQALLHAPARPMARPDFRRLAPAARMAWSAWRVVRQRCDGTDGLVDVKRFPAGPATRRSGRSGRTCRLCSVDRRAGSAYCGPLPQWADLVISFGATAFGFRKCVARTELLPPGIQRHSAPPRSARPSPTGAIHPPWSCPRRMRVPEPNKARVTREAGLLSESCREG